MLRIVDRPTADPVTLSEAKAQLRLTDTSNDILVKALIPAATRLVQSLVQRVVMPQTLEWVLQSWPQDRVIEIPVAPVAADDINSITYVDWTTQTEQTLDPSLYVVQTRGDSVRIIPAFGVIWPIVFKWASEPVVINFDAGYDDPCDIPGTIKAAILLQIRHLYSVGEINPLLRKDTVIGLGEKQYQLTPETMQLIPDAVRNLILADVW